MTNTDTADRSLAGIRALLPSTDPRPLKWRAGPAGRASGSHTATKAEAQRAAAHQNRIRAELIRQGALTAAAPRWIVEPFTPIHAR